MSGDQQVHEGKGFTQGFKLCPQTPAGGGTGGVPRQDFDGGEKALDNAAQGRPCWSARQSIENLGLANH